jgi:hypothetical protein
MRPGPGLAGWKLAGVWDEAAWLIASAKQTKLVDNAHPLAAGIGREVSDGGTPRPERFLIQIFRFTRGEEAV